MKRIRGRKTRNTGQASTPGGRGAKERQRVVVQTRSPARQNPRTKRTITEERKGKRWRATMGGTEEKLTGNQGRKRENIKKGNR